MVWPPVLNYPVVVLNVGDKLPWCNECIVIFRSIFPRRGSNLSGQSGRGFHKPRLVWSKLLKATGLGNAHRCLGKARRCLCEACKCLCKACKYLGQACRYPGKARRGRLAIEMCLAFRFTYGQRFIRIILYHSKTYRSPRPNPTWVLESRSPTVLPGCS